MELKEKIDAIYEKIANKDLNFGCKIFHKVDWKRSFKARIITDKIEKDYGTFYWVKLDSENSVTWLQEKEMEIIGHPVMIGDVMDYIENITLDKIYSYIWVKKEEIPDLILQKTKDAMMKIFPLWKQKRKPIEEQSDDCIDFIYNLILCTKNIKN